MPHLSRYYTLHVIVRGIRIWPQYAAKCYKNASKFFPDVKLLVALTSKKILLLRAYFLGLKNRGNRGTVVGVGINGLKCGVVAVIHCLRCSAFGLARLLS